MKKSAGKSAGLLPESESGSAFFFLATEGDRHFEERLVIRLSKNIGPKARDDYKNYS